MPVDQDRLAEFFPAAAQKTAQRLMIRLPMLFDPPARLWSLMENRSSVTKTSFDLVE